MTGAVNTGHGSTTASASNGATQDKTCLWTTFPTSIGQVLTINLKADFSESGSLTGGGATNAFIIEYSLNGGSSWNTLRAAFNITSSSSGTATQSLSASQDISQIRVRDLLEGSTTDVGESASVTASVSLIRLEITTREATLIAMM